MVVGDEDIIDLLDFRSLRGFDDAVSISSDWPEGDTISVACPPSTSTKKISSVLAASSAEARASRAQIKKQT
jgi:hypothetical protein